ncbi:MAG TPA: DUF1254 domain-containing protein [Thermoguttaceae bacterium]|nr:DUF1254 domain-containing protein [Thermoguttaceae bacterium]
MESRKHDGHGHERKQPSRLKLNSAAKTEWIKIWEPNHEKDISYAIAALLLGAALAAPLQAAELVTVDNFARAETDRTMKDYVDLGGFGKFYHTRVPSPLDKQSVVRLNLDTLYSFGVFDLTTPVTITLPDSGDRFMSALIISEDHSMLPVVYAPTEFTVTQEQMGTRYVIIALRTFMAATDKDDIAKANALQDKVTVSQAEVGSFDVPEWDQDSLLKVRGALAVLASSVSDTRGFFGDKSKLDRLDFLMGTAAGWGGNPKEAAIYFTHSPEKNDGKIPYSVTVKDVPLEGNGFWSITVYNEANYLEPNDLGVNALNNVTAKKNADGSITINAGGCDDGRINCIPITKGWNYVARTYRPRPEIVSGDWVFPEMQPAK